MSRHGRCLCQPTNSSSSLRKIEWLSVLALARQNYHSLASCWTATEVITNLPTAWFNLILTLNGLQVMTQDLILFRWEDACVSYMALLGVISYWLSPLYCPSDSQVHTHSLIFHREIEGKKFPLSTSGWALYFVTSCFGKSSLCFMMLSFPWVLFPPSYDFTYHVFSPMHNLSSSLYSHGQSTCLNYFLR